MVKSASISCPKGLGTMSDPKAPRARHRSAKVACPRPMTAREERCGGGMGLERRPTYTGFHLPSFFAGIFFGFDLISRHGSSRIECNLIELERA